METMCHCTSKNNGIPNWKFVLGCCDECPSIVTPIQEANKDTSTILPKIIFHVNLQKYKYVRQDKNKRNVMLNHNTNKIGIFI